MQLLAYNETNSCKKLKERVKVLLFISDMIKDYLFIEAIL